ncbi:MAG: YrrS family protein [Bacillota bacterium]|nr:YrrS family protein [Bacillota bacterium]
MNQDFQSNSRSSYRAKRKKTNIILNGLIIIVLLLIAIVAYSIFSTGNDKTASKGTSQKTEAKQTQHKEKSQKNVAANSGDQNSTGDQNVQSGTGDSSTPGNTNDSEAVTTEGGSSPDVQQTIQNPDWKPVGTTQNGQHSAVYDSSSTDWQEMLNAISYATGLDKSNMTVWFLGRDKNTANGSVGTVSSKDKQQKFRVYIEWVDGQGWKPTKVEELSEITKGN